MTKLEEILARDFDTCAGCGGLATKILLSYCVEGRSLEHYPDFAWKSYCVACACLPDERPSPDALLAWEEIAGKLSEMATENGALAILSAITNAQSRTVDVGDIIDVIDGIKLIPECELS